MVTTAVSVTAERTACGDGSRSRGTGLLDGSKLYGVLAEIEALGLDLLEVRQLTQDRKSPEP